MDRRKCLGGLVAGLAGAFAVKANDQTTLPADDDDNDELKRLRERVDLLEKFALKVCGDLYPPQPAIKHMTISEAKKCGVDVNPIVEQPTRVKKILARRG